MINFGFCNILINFTQHIDLINMKKRDFKAGVVAALGTALVASCGTTNAANTERDLKNLESKDSALLEKRLMELAAMPARKDYQSAMCYSPTSYPFNTAEYICPSCGAKSMVNEIDLGRASSIKELFEKIKAEGYDVSIDFSEYCSSCSDVQVIRNPAPIFKVRFTKNSKYHEVKTDLISDYETLLAFLRNEKTYKNAVDESYLPEEIYVIQKMTGLGKGLNYKKK